MTDDSLQARKDEDCWDKDRKCRGSGLESAPSPLPGFTRRQIRFSLWYFLLFLLVVAFVNARLPSPGRLAQIEYSDFKAKIASGEIKRVEIGDREYLGFTEGKGAHEALPQDATPAGTSASPTIYRTVPVPDDSFVPLLDRHAVEYYGRRDAQNPLLGYLLSWILPMGVMVVVWSLLMRRMGKLGSGVMSFGGNRAQLVAEGDIDVRFDDVAGIDEAKEELAEIVDFLNHPERYTAVGGKIPKGILLVGPPGTGKTLCARAVAGEAGVPFFKMSGADFVEMFVGVGAARVRDLFRQAREKAPCIIFIDELDAIGKARGAVAVGGHDEREQTLNQLLVEMDGFDSRSGVIILAATNRPEILDPALLRPGRFDRQILVDRPDLAGREAILRLHARNVAVAADVDLRDIAAMTPGFAGADLENLVNEAALLAVRRGLDKVGKREFEDAIEKIVAGLEKKNRLLNGKEREIVAHHEAGHALTAAFTTGADAVKKISIVPRGLSALGYTMQTPTEDRYLMTEAELLGKIDVLLGGRAAEMTVFGEISTGAANDLARATEIARKMFTEYGMSDRFRNVALQTRSAAAFLGEQAAGARRDYSEQTQHYIDEAVARIIAERYDRVLELMREKQDLLRAIAAELLARETLDGAEFERLLQAGK